MSDSTKLNEIRSNPGYGTQLIHWPKLQPTEEEIKQLPSIGLVHIRKLLLSLVEAVLRACPWQDRADLVPLLDPAQRYAVGQILALPIPEPNDLRPQMWKFGTVVGTEDAENPKQGQFQVIDLEVDGTTTQLAVGVPDAQPIPLKFPPANPEDMHWLAGRITDAYFSSLRQLVGNLLASGRLAGTQYQDQVLLGNIETYFGDVEKLFLEEIFANLNPGLPWLTTDQVLAQLRNNGGLTDLPDDIARFILHKGLAELGYKDLGGDRWTTTELFDAINRSINRRPNVPRIRSKVKQELGEVEEDLQPYSEEDLSDEAKQELDAYEDNLPTEEQLSEWQPPIGPIQLPIFTYVHIREGYFPLGRNLAKAFDPHIEQSVVSIQIVQGEPLHFLVDRKAGVLKAIDIERFHQHFRYEEFIPPGTKLWLEYRNENLYRLAPRPINTPRDIRCKLLHLDDQRHLVIEELPITVSYESEDNIFRSELKYEDIEALYAEAKRLGWSIFDTIYYTFKDLAQNNPNVTLHHTDVFNIVFFRYRMCSPLSVIAELYNNPCFEQVGGGYFRFAPDRRLTVARASRRTTRPTRQAAIPNQPTGISAQVDQSNVQLPEPEITPYFIFQQSADSEYADQPGTIYNWRQGIPGSNQIKPGSRFIYYRTGEKVFFGSGKIEHIDTYLSDDGETYHNGWIADYQPWDPPLPLTQQLAKKLTFIDPGRLWVGQAGIRHITQEDFENLTQAYPDREGIKPPKAEEDGLPTDSNLPNIPSNPISEAEAPDEFWLEIKKLAGKRLQTLGEAASFDVENVDDKAVKIKVLSVGSQYSISRLELTKIWGVLNERGELHQSAIRQELNMPNPTYAASILAALPGVTYKTSPIRLVIKKGPPDVLPDDYTEADNKPALPPQKLERTRSGQMVAADLLRGPLEVWADSARHSTDTTGEPAPSNANESQNLTDRVKAEPAIVILPTHPSRRQRPPTANRADMQSKTLFSTHYLQTRLPDHPEWQEDPKLVFDQVRQLWQKARQYGNIWSEAQTEQELIKPLLDVLQWSYIVQPKSVKKGRVTRPDYALFVGPKARDEAYPHQGNDDAFYSRALAIAEAKYWGRPLSQQDQSGRSTWKAESNPSHQMVSYLVGTRCPWGILTNGMLWRLYSREVSSTASEYYEIDLSLIFDFLSPDGQPTPDQMDAFRRWWLFFRLAAFLPDPQGKSFVQRVHQGSATYASQVSEKLKELVFEEVMPTIAAGFVAYRRQQLKITTETPETLSEIYRASLSLLYKLLFLLYAEARSLLPMDNPDYRSYSLTAMAEWAAEQIDQKRKLSEATYATQRYDALLALFHRVDQGDPSLAIPHYNGGLFSPHSLENQFLESHKLSDQAVAQAVDVLVRDQGQPVDYAYISVRNLGAIYEGLLENKLVISSLPAGDGSEVKVDLVNDKGERKATGSYYTPDYIVEYIVEHTLDPVLEGRQAGYEKAMTQVTELHQKLAKTPDPATNRRLQGERAEAERQAREAFLGIKVLDPAMGSGHFLVNAVDHLTDGIIQRMQAYHDAHPEALWEWDPIQQLINRVRAEIVAEMAAQGLNVETRRLDDTALLTRLVMKRCIYGVDLNRMAVELAKVSLWLHSFTVGAPLSFLDHHLRWGNSLIGTDVRTVEANITVKKQEKRISVQAKGRAKARGETAREVETAFQSSLFGGPFKGLLDLTAIMIEIAERADATLADVRESAQAYEQLQKTLVPYKQALNLWVSQYFGNPGAKDFMELYGNDVLPAISGECKVAEQYQQVVNAAQPLWREKHFFHWDLEFPEVFVDLRQRNWAVNPGFDAVIGNPPYVRGRALPSEDKYWFDSKYVSAYKSYDLYVLFVELGIQILRSDGVFGMIVPRSFLTESYGEAIREYVLDKTRIRFIVDYLGVKIFEGVSVINCVPILQKTIKPENKEENDVEVIRVALRSSHKIRQDFFRDIPQYMFRIELTSMDALIVNNILKDSGKIGDICYVSYSIAAHSEVESKGKDEYLSDIVINEKSKKFIEGKEIDRYSIQWQGRYLLYDPKILRRPSLPELFENPKITVLGISGTTGITAAFDEEHFYVGYPAICLTLKNFLRGVIRQDVQFDEIEYKLSSQYDLRYILAILNSKLMKYFFDKMIFSTSQTIYSDNIRELPLRRISFVTPNNRRKGQLAIIQAIYSTEPTDSVLTFIGTHLSEQVDVIHDVLAYLAEQMIDLNKARQVEVKGFLGWLERSIGANLDGLTGKTMLQNYLGDYQKGEKPATLEQILAVLKKNQKKLTVDVSSRTFLERLEKEYQTSLDKLLPIKQKLAQTDWLIDQIVYALYGLTEEEIAIVEGRAVQESNLPVADAVTDKSQTQPAIIQQHSHPEEKSDSVEARIASALDEIRTSIIGHSPEEVKKQLGNWGIQRHLYPPILRVLAKQGGKARGQDIIRQVFSELDPQLIQAHPDELGKAWGNKYFYSAIGVLKNWGILNPDLVRGVYELTEKGWQIFKSSQKE